MEQLVRAVAGVVGLLPVALLCCARGVTIVGSWTAFFPCFYVGLYLFLLAWSCSLPFIVRYTILGLLLWQVFERVVSVYPLHQVVVLFLVLLAVHAIIAHWKLSSEYTNTFKTLWLDWVFLVPLFPVFAFSDLLLKTELFYSVLGYFCGANFYGVSLIKSAEWTWTQHSRTPQGGTTTTQQWMTFIHQIKVTPLSWQRLHFQQLLLCLWCIGMLFGTEMLDVWQSVERWQLAFSVGAFSTICLYLGPIAAGAALSPSELEAVRDSTN